MAEKDLTQVLPQKLLRDQAPSSRQQATGWVGWDGLGQVIGQPFANSRTHRIPLSKLYEMRNDSMIRFALQFIRVPLIRAPWYIDSNSAQVSAFVDSSLRKVYEQMIMKFSLSLEFGWAPIIKRFEAMKPDWTYIDPSDPTASEKLVWDNGNIEAIVWKEPITVRPELATPRWSLAGDFNGFTYPKVFAQRPNPFTQDQSNNTVDVFHALWVTNEKYKEFDSIYGYPRIEYSHKFWWSWEFNWALANRAFEKHADPAIAVYYPPQNIINDIDGTVVDPSTVAMRIGEDLRSGATVTIPNEYDMLADGRVGNRLWEIKPIEIDVAFEALNSRFEYMDIMKIRSCLVPDMAFIQGSGANSNRNVVGELGDAFTESQNVLLAEYFNQINRYFIPQIIATNFPEYKGEVSIKTRGLASRDLELLRQVVQLVGQDDPSNLGVDIQQIMKDYSIPLLSKEQQDAAREEKLKWMQESSQTTAEQFPGSGISPQQLQSQMSQDTPDDIDDGKVIISNGKYVQPREKIIIP